MTFAKMVCNVTLSQQLIRSFQSLRIFFSSSRIHTSDCRDFPRERWMSYIHHRAPARRYDWTRWREVKNTSTSHSRKHKCYSRAYLLRGLRLWSNIFPPTVSACIPPALWFHFAKTKNIDCILCMLLERYCRYISTFQHSRKTQLETCREHK